MTTAQSRISRARHAATRDVGTVAVTHGQVGRPGAAVDEPVVREHSKGPGTGQCGESIFGAPEASVFELIDEAQNGSGACLGAGMGFLGTSARARCPAARAGEYWSRPNSVGTLVHRRHVSQSRRDGVIRA